MNNNTEPAKPADEITQEQPRDPEPCITQAVRVIVGKNLFEKKEQQ